MVMMEDLEELVLLPIAKTTMAREMEKPRARAHGRVSKDFVETGQDSVAAQHMTITNAAMIILLISPSK